MSTKLSFLGNRKYFPEFKGGSLFLKIIKIIISSNRIMLVFFGQLDHVIVYFAS